MYKIPSPFGRLINNDLTVIFGFFWAGKTFYTVIQAYEAYLRWDIVVSNMWLAFPHVRWYTADELPPIIEEVRKYHDNFATPMSAPNSFIFSHNIERQKGKPRRFFFLIDEWAIFFNARNFKKNFENPDMIEFLVQPRKYNCAIAVICQSLKMIDVNFIRLAQEIIEFRKWIGWLFRLWEAFDTKFLNLEEGWNPDTPVTRRKFYLHPYYTTKSQITFFGWLYYTKEILGERAVRSDEHIKSIREYSHKETTDPNFHAWRTKFRLIKQQLFWLTEEQEKEDTENAHTSEKVEIPEMKKEEWKKWEREWKEE